jgi:hypothetical protein
VDSGWFGVLGFSALSGIPGILDDEPSTTNH